MAAVFGDDDFKEWVYDELLPELTVEGKSRVVQPNLTMEAVTEGGCSLLQYELRRD
jgi:prophage antirepressor-like protein